MCEGVKRGGLEGKIVAVIMISEKNTKSCQTQVEEQLDVPHAEPTALHMFDTRYSDVCSCIVEISSARVNTRENAAEPVMNMHIDNFLLLAVVIIKDSLL